MRRRTRLGILALLAVVGVLLIPTASGAATARVRVRIPRLVTTTTVVPVADQAAAPVVVGSPAPVTAEATVPGFSFGPFRFFGVTFPAVSLPAFEIPDFPGSQFVVNAITSVQNIIRNALCQALGSSFCASS